MDKLRCKKCETEQTENELEVSWQVFGDGSEHIRGTCCNCGNWIKWLPKTENNLLRLGEW